jgi:serine/threonine-protein kinase
MTTRARPISPRTDDRLAFAPGQVFAERYRIVTLLGHGGMGDVYRADDLRVGQPAALKFLARRSSSPSRRQERFVRELRLARQIAHPNVCRVYDIGEWNGRPYLSMEYIDGEDLRSLLTRVGRLPADKALDVAHQLCAGLAAAHEQGVLHLDLKPANVMIDGRGRAMIMDFGVARSAGEEITSAVAGTPAYMPPEQRAGGPLSVQTDLYALGLVMFEMFTGHRARGADAVLESQGDVRDGEPLPPSRLVRDIDPRIEDVILACLEREIADRPRSAISVATALPGGEPLAAALAAGRIPSPEMVAATRREALRPAIAAMLAASLLGGVAVISVLNRNVLRELAPRLSPPVLVARAQDVIRSLGYDHAPADSAYWFTWKSSYREQASDRDATFRLNEGEPPRTARLLRFIYRESPSPLLAGNLFGRVLYRDPPAEVPGMADVNLDTEGHLLRLCAIPGVREPQAGSLPAAPSWGLLLARAGLHVDDLSPVLPLRTPPVAYDTWAEWEMRSSAPDERVRVTAAAFDGRPVYFDIGAVQPHSSQRASDDTRTVSRLTSDPTILVVCFVVGLVCAVLIARHRLLLGQADRRGASRLALYFFSLNLISTVLWPDHVAHFGEEYFLAARCLAWGLYWCAIGAVFYLAFEPSVRRRWPAMLIGWNRVLAGRLRDPIVGRDVLIGTVAGTVMVGIMWLAYAAGTWLGLTVASPFRPALEGFREPRHVAALVIFLHASTLAVGLGVLFMLLILRRLLRARWLALAAWIVGFAVIALHAFTLGFDWRIGLPAGLAGAAIAALLLDRFGLVALCAMAFTSSMLTRLPVALEFSAWYANRSLISLGIVVGIGLYGARMAVGGPARRAGSELRPRRRVRTVFDPPHL